MGWRKGLEIRNDRPSYDCCGVRNKFWKPSC